jgi:hypothetical protein
VYPAVVSPVLSICKEFVKGLSVSWQFLRVCPKFWADRGEMGGHPPNPPACGAFPKILDTPIFANCLQIPLG